MTKIVKGRRVLTTSDSQQLLNGLDKEYSVKLQALASEQRRILRNILKIFLITITDTYEK